MYHQPGVQYAQPGMMMQPMQPMMAPSGMTMGTSMMTYPPISWMPAPPPMKGVPAGLEYLNTLDRLQIRQQIEMLEIFIGFETTNRYTVLNALGQHMFGAAEINDCCWAQCGPGRSFNMAIIDALGREVIHLVRPCRCSSCWCFCCLQEMEIQAPPGNPIGFIEQEWTLWVPKFRILNANRETVLRVEGPCCTIACCSDVEFSIVTPTDGVEIGKLTKKWAGYVQEAFTDADNFAIFFPVDLDVHTKAALLGLTFLIDFMFFEQAANHENSPAGRGMRGGMHGGHMHGGMHGGMHGMHGGGMHAGHMHSHL